MRPGWRDFPRDLDRDWRSTMSNSRNLGARMGRWSAQHRKTAIFGWLAFFRERLSESSYLESPPDLSREA